MGASLRAVRVAVWSLGIAAAPALADPPPGKGGGGGGGDDGGGTPPPADPAIAFIGGSNEMLGVMNEDGSNVTALDLAPAGFPSWSPDLDGDASNGYQGALAFELRLADGIEHGVIADVRVIGGVPTAVRVRTLTLGYGYYPAWSPDLDAAAPGYQGRIAFVDDNFFIAAQSVAWDGDATDPSTVHDPVQAMLVGADVLGPELFAFHPTWSPDGTRLAFQSMDFDFANALYVVDDLATPQPRAITNDPAASYHAPDWSNTRSVVGYSKDRSIVLNDVDQVGEVVVGVSGNGLSFSVDDLSIVFAGMVGRNWSIQRHDFSTGVTTTLLAQKRINFKDPDWRPFD